MRPGQWSVGNQLPFELIGTPLGTKVQVQRRWRLELNLPDRTNLNSELRKGKASLLDPAPGGLFESRGTCAGKPRLVQSPNAKIISDFVASGCEAPCRQSQ
jgi:hypothetical protein